MGVKIRFFVKNYLVNHEQSSRVVTVDVPLYLAPTGEKVIEWLKRQQPYLLEGEKWEIIKIDKLN